MGPVLHFIDTTGPGGAETVFLQVAHELRSRGWDSRAVLIGPGWVLERAERLELTVHLIETKGRFDFRLGRELRAIVKRFDIRLIHAHMLSAAVYASAIGRITGTPVVATFHGSPDSAPGGLGRVLRHRLIRSAAAVVAVSDALREELVLNGGYRRETVHTIHNGVDTGAFARADGAHLREEMGIPAEAVLVGALGNLRHAKDYPTLLKAAAELSDLPNLVFAVAGERSEPLHAELLRLRDDLGLGDRVSFWGFRDDPETVLSAFDVLAISSRSEGFSLAAVQAMAAGTPVVATRSGGPEEIITDGRDGLLVPPGTPAALANGIRRLVSDPALRSNLVTQGRRTAEERFSLAAMLEGYEAIYRSLLDGFRGGR